MAQLDKNSVVILSLIIYLYVILYKITDKGRSRRIIISIQSCFHPIEYIVDVSHENTLRICIANSTPTCLDSPSRNDYPFEIVCHPKYGRNILYIPL